MKFFWILIFSILSFSCSALVNKASLMGIEGYVVNKNNEPESEVYIYLYRSMSSGLIGPSDFMEKTDEKGYFFFDVPEGTYYLVARKRLRGGDAGPLREGDRVSIYANNPVYVKANAISKVKILLPDSSPFYQRKMPIGDKKISIKIKGEIKKNLKLLIYEGDDLKKSPLYIYDVKENESNISLSSGKKYILMLREGIKEKIGDLEFYKIYGPFLADDVNMVEFEIK